VNVANLYPEADRTVAKEDVDTTFERSNEAEAELKDRDDSLEQLEEDATVERKLADDQAKQLGLTDAFKESDAYVAKIERWAQAAELAQVCLVRGG